MPCSNAAKTRNPLKFAGLLQTTGSISAISLQLRHSSTIGKNLVKHQYVLHISSQYGKLRPTNGWDRLTNLGHPCKFQLVSHLCSVTARHLAVGVSQTLRRWTEGATCIRQGDHHVWHWPTFLVSVKMPFFLNYCWARFPWEPLGMIVSSPLVDLQSSHGPSTHYVLSPLGSDRLPHPVRDCGILSRTRSRPPCHCQTFGTN